MQTPKTRARLMRRWGGAPILGSVGVWDLLHLLHFTIDHTDTVLRYASLYYAHPIPSYSTRTAATYTVPLAILRPPSCCSAVTLPLPLRLLPLPLLLLLLLPATTAANSSCIVLLLLLLLIRLPYYMRTPAH